MRIWLTPGRRAALALAVAALVAGVLASPWGVATRGGAGARADGPRTVRTTPARPDPAPGTPSAAKTPPPGGSPAQVAQAAVDAAVPKIMAGRSPDSVSLVATDPTSGVTVGWGARTPITAASVFKLTLLECYLLSDQERGQQPGDGDPDGLTSMIENSDNDAADRVYALLGGDGGVSSRMSRLGLSTTKLGPGGQWGLSTTTAVDQAALLTDLVSPSSPLSADSRSYAVGLMDDVESDQRWGVGAAADPGTQFANKNGWLNVDDDDGRWVVSSVGLVDVGGHQVQLAVLTQHDADLADGTQLVESLSQAVATALRHASTGGG